MGRRNFYDIIRNSPINVKAEYDRIYELYAGEAYVCCIEEWVDERFIDFPKSFRKRTVSLEDFNNTYGFRFDKYGSKREKSTDVLLTFCEYVINLCNQLCEAEGIFYEEDESLEILYEAIHDCVDELGLMEVKKEDIIIYVEKNPTAVAVAEIVPEEIAYSVLEYNHFRLKGDLSRKKAILKLMADDIESERKTLKGINGNLETQLYQLMNKFVRHDHSQTPYIATMKEEEIEAVYDDIYQMWLLAKMEMDQVERGKKVKELLREMNGGCINTSYL